MNSKVLKLVLLIYFSLVIVVPVYSVSVTDQQQLLTDINPVAIGGTSLQKLAQVITAGADGELVVLQLHIGESHDSTEPLHVEVQEVTDGIPTGVIITEEVVPSGVVPSILDDDSWDSITFSNPAYFNAGDQFAIVLWSNGEYACLRSPTGDFYLGGDGYFISLPNPLDIWARFFTKRDLAFQTVVEPTLITVSIDIKPNTDPNSINLGSKGKISVAVISTPDFDASTVDPVTVRFADAFPLRWTMKDVDGDGDVDMQFFFQTQELNLVSTSTEAALMGLTFSGVSVEGTDSVDIVPKK